MISSTGIASARIEALEHVDDDDGDVVAAAAVVRHRDEDARGLGRVVGVEQHVGDALVGTSLKRPSLQSR